MKVVVAFCKNKSKKFEMEIDENNDVKHVKMMIEKLTETNEKYTEDYFHIFHRNIILDNDRMVKFYAIEPNDEIYIGKIEHYLEIDDEIVELFVVGYNLSFEYVVIKRNDSISQLKFLISRIIPECVTVWSFSGITMTDDIIITDILIINRCYKLIIECGETSGSFSDYLMIQDRYLVSSYAEKQKISFWSLDPYSESEILELKRKLIELKKSLENNEIIPKLNESLANIPLSFIRSQYLFSMNTADEIWNICNHHWSDKIGQDSIHRFIRNIFRVELNEELLIYSNIYSNLSNIIDSVLDYSTCNRSVITNNIRKSMIKLLSKCEPLLMKWEWYNLQENIDSIPSEYIDCVNEIADEIVNEIKTEFIIDNEDPLKTCKEITNECIDKYKRKICGLLIKTEKKRRLYKKKQFGFFRSHFNKIIIQSFGKILNFTQMYIDSREMKNERFEDIIKQHVACLLREYMNVIIDRVYKKRNYSKWNELDVNEIINESIRRMFIRLVLNSYENAKSELCNVNRNMSSDENTSSADITNELLEKKNIHNKLMDKLLRLLPGNGEFEKIVRNEIDRLVYEQNFDCTHEDIVKDSVKLFLDSEFFNGKFIEESSREIFNSLFNDKIFGFINKTNLFNIHIYEQTRDCDISRKYFKQYVIPSLINHSMFQEILRNMLNIESIKLERNNCKENRIAEEFIKHVTESVLSHAKIFTIKSDNSLRSIVINALYKCIISLDDIFENPKYFMKFVRPFLSNNQSDSYIDEILTVVSEENFASLKIKHNNYEISLQIPVCQIKTIIQLKKSISTQTKIPIQQIYMIKYGEDEIPKDKEIMGSICDYLVTFVSSMENTKVMKMLAKGAFGVAYLCEDKLSKYQFVLKKSRSFDINLNRDISINLQLQLSNIFTGFYRVYLYEQSFCIGMEYFSRGSLRSVLNENKRLSERDIAQYSHQILTQINLMHEESISHRDIKPDNVVIDKDNNARLIDFGLSKNMAGLTDKDLLEKLNKYSVGTLGYMAPELIKSEIYSEKIDIWSFGIMVGEMSTGKKPFHNMMGLQSAIYVTSSELINLYLPDDTSEELAQFIYSCLNKNPNERPTAKQLLESRFIRIHTNKNDTIDV